MNRRTDLPLIYACSGCSNVAQLANNAAVAMDRRGLAEMSCISGVGGGVKSLVKVACSGRPIIAVDGCLLGCVKQCLNNVNVTPKVYVRLDEQGYRKRYGEDCSEGDLEVVVEQIQVAIAQAGLDAQ
ncbi:putative zinc-binding protein [Hahella sp. HN01]|uniref:putative zinc-binding protein n=1 Tax=Hahella sp. HN01 TaxID=2847262 RepID=UPI001C1F02F4|nr:putative zinc-binding protein [Hahella sp. HN01]MBU6953252.1 putative zinc-binding protein [Hahella sp. HN01]